MLKRLARTGINLTVLAASIVVFVLAFLMLQLVAAAQQPKTMEVLTAVRDLNVGDVITPLDLAARKVYVDDNASLYIPAQEQDGVIGGIVAIPLKAGQPLFRYSLVAPAAEGTRLSAVLSKYPDHSLFPLPLEMANIVAPSAETFLPGDLVDITVVIGRRPSPPETPATDSLESPQAAQIELPGMPTPIPTPTLTAEQQAEEEAKMRTFPPLAKSLLPQGARVLAVQGLGKGQGGKEQGQEGMSPDASAFAELSKPKILILLVPTAAVEPLSLALQGGDLVVITLLARGSEQPTTGFTYWDLEELFKADRQRVLGGP